MVNKDVYFSISFDCATSSVTDRSRVYSRSAFSHKSTSCIMGKNILVAFTIGSNCARTIYRFLHNASRIKRAFCSTVTVLSSLGRIILHVVNSSPLNVVPTYMNQCNLSYCSIDSCMRRCPSDRSPKTVKHFGLCQVNCCNAINQLL